MRNLLGSICQRLKACLQIGCRVHVEDDAHLMSLAVMARTVSYEMHCCVMILPYAEGLVTPSSCRMRLLLWRLSKAFFISKVCGDSP